MPRVNIRNMREETVRLIEQRAKELEISRDKLMAEVLDNYAERISENKAAEIIHTQIDSLMLNQNRLIEATNNSATNISKALNESMKLSNKILEEFKIVKNSHK